MKKEFNDTGLCVPNMHYMVNTSKQINEIFNNLIERGKYFTINRARQFGKTTTIFLLSEYLKKKHDYFVIRTSFEGIGDEIFKDAEEFSKHIVEIMVETLHATSLPESYDEKFTNETFKHLKTVTSLKILSRFITEFNQKLNKKVVLIIDEVDKSSNNQLFLNFLGMLRDKYLLRNEGSYYTFHSVILVGVQDIKTLKLKIRDGKEVKLNSPWNIAVDFEIDLSFKPDDIVTMLDDYTQDTGIKMDKKAISEKLYYYTSGYPYLVSKLCKFIDEKIITQRKAQNWYTDDVEIAYKLITAPDYQTTLFDSLFKNLQGYEELHKTVKYIVMGGLSLSYDTYDPIVNFGKIYGIFKNDNGICKIHNRIFEQRIYSYFITRTIRENALKQPNFHPDFYYKDELNLKFILQKFQQFMKENYSYKDEKFIERKGRLLFLSFLKPIINQRGYEFKEPTVADERRMDIVITFNQKRYVTELKIWRGAEYHKTGLQQLSDYLDIYSLKNGYLLIYDFNKNKQYKDEIIKFKDKEIFAVWV
ncbi:MAG: AAA family ATPase [Bacteroidia bacterium]|nr:AAA family ATPase [Bacteroidia bacterium]